VAKRTFRSRLNNTNIKKKKMLQLTAKFPSGAAYLNQPLWVEVTLKNTGDSPLLINSRFAMGYKLSISRELYAELVDETAPHDAVYSSVKINRDDPAASDYSLLQSGKSITKKIDFFHYYHPRKPGKYSIKIFYQADEALKNRPDGVYKGTISTDPASIEILIGKLFGQNE
jgi:hypothetical protein